MPSQWRPYFAASENCYAEIVRRNPGDEAAIFMRAHSLFGLGCYTKATEVVVGVTTPQSWAALRTGTDAGAEPVVKYPHK